VREEVDLIGIVRKNEPREALAPKSVVTNDTFTLRDVDAMADKLGTARVFLDADEHSSVKGGPVGGQTRVTLRNEHFSYILTWWVKGIV